MNPSQNDSFDSFSNGQGGNVQTGGHIDGPNRAGMGGQQIVPPMSVSTEGLTVLNNGEGKKSKKWAWAIVLFLCVTIMVLILFVFLNNHNEDTINNYKKSFNEFANYVISGTDSDKEIEEKYNASENYYFLVEQSTEESRKALFEKVDLLLDNFVNAYKLIPKDSFSNDEDHTKIDDIISDEREIFSFIKVVYIKRMLRQIDIERKFLELGRDNLKTEMLSYYDFSDLNNNQYLNDFSELFNAWVEAQLDVLNTLQEYGCAATINVYVNCSKEIDDETKELINSKKEAIKETEGDLWYYYSLSSNFIANVFLMNDYINNYESGVLAGDNNE